MIPANQTLLERTPTQVPSDLLLVGVVTLSSPGFVSFLSQTYNILHQNRLGIPVCLASSLRNTLYVEAKHCRPNITF